MNYRHLLSAMLLKILLKAISQVAMPTSPIHLMHYWFSNQMLVDPKKTKNLTEIQCLRYHAALKHCLVNFVQLQNTQKRRTM